MLTWWEWRRIGGGRGAAKKEAEGKLKHKDSENEEEEESKVMNKDLTENQKIRERRVITARSSSEGLTRAREDQHQD